GVEAWRPLRARERRALERADRVLSISAHTARRFRAANPDVTMRGAIDVCLLGTDDAPERHATAAPVGGFALIVGRMWAEERYKGHDLLVDAWRDVQARVPDARLVIVGDGDDRRRLEARVRDEGLAPAIAFAGLVSDVELATLYRACAFFVMPSANEGFGLAFLEAMRAGKPCIAAHGSADEIIENGVSGVVIDPASRGELVDAFVRLFTDHSGRSRMGTAARARVDSHFTERHFASRFRAAMGLTVSHA